MSCLLPNLDLFCNILPTNLSGGQLMSMVHGRVVNASAPCSWSMALWFRPAQVLGQSRQVPGLLFEDFVLFSKERHVVLVQLLPALLTRGIKGLDLHLAEWELQLAVLDRWPKCVALLRREMRLVALHLLDVSQLLCECFVSRTGAFKVVVEALSDKIAVSDKDRHRVMMVHRGGFSVGRHDDC